MIALARYIIIIITTTSCFVSDPRSAS